MPYRTEEIWCGNGSSRVYGVAYIPEAEGRVPLVIFSHEPGNNHEAGVRYAERLAEHGYAAYVFDFRGGSAGGTQNRSDGSNSEMSVLTEASDLSAARGSPGSTKASFRAFAILRSAMAEPLLWS